ncbi:MULTISPECIES: iron chelate uptake ABC transporter family permease subunit [unclassified Actinomyces]|uniref:FecCD family ABC transporter permease n=1 Tax=unclassified Actinomyces TaxID=2609248 RepID=UPI000D598884|nr:MULTISPECIES: iron ABC transporter permease [unclassified Actinomyces]RAX22568.1 iron ABC transporter permease [Actinomyces sp. Z3]
MSAAAAAVEPGFTEAGRRRRQRRYLAVTTALAALVACLWWLMLLSGTTWYSPAEVVAVMAGRDVPGAVFAVGQLRLPRALLGLLAGAAFGMAGRTSQTMLRNQLASPDVIGITSGASMAAVFAILVLGWSGMRVNLLALVCGLGTALVIYLLSGTGSTQGGRLILIGIGISAMFSSVISYLQLRASIYSVADAMRWLSGSLGDASWGQVPLLAGAVVLLGGTLLALGRNLTTLSLGEESATGLGVHVDRTRLVLLLSTVALAAFATAATGPIAFVAFLAGPLTARLVGRTDRALLAPSALMGAAIVLGADLAGQHLFPTALPVGVVTGIVGAPYLLLQLVRLNREGASA